VPDVRPVIAVVGPTATGKSDLAIALAQRFDGEIVNADSMQLYRGMDIGTAKLAEDERGGIEHHVLDIWPVTRTASVAEYQFISRIAIDAIHARGRVPVLVGGSGLYVRAALDKLEFPAESPEVRSRLMAELADVGPEALHARLAEVDPIAATAILPTNDRRIVRALEVFEITGRPFSATMPTFDSLYDTTFLGLDRADLDERIAARVHRMVGAGLLDEVRGLLPLGIRATTAGKALGYQQLLDVLDDDGTVTGDVDGAVAETIRATTRFVRRQRSWFRRDPRVRWLDAAAPDLVDAAAALVPLKP